MTDMKVYNNGSGYNLIDISVAELKGLLMSTRNRDRQSLIDRIIRLDTRLQSKIEERKSALKKCEWALETSGNKTIDEFVKNNLWKVLSDDVFSSIQSAFFRGVNVLEIMWESNGSRAEVIGFKNHSPFSFDYDAEKNLKIYSAEHDKYYSFPENKCIITYAPLVIAGFPVSIIETLAPLIVLKYYALHKNWARFNEACTMPIIIGKYDHNTEGARNALFEGLKNLAQNTIGVVPKETEITALEMSQDSSDTFERLINKINDEISIAILGQNLTTEVKSGSLAASQTHQDIRDDILESSINMVCSAINEQLIKPLVDFNFNSQEYPTFNLILPESTEKKATKDKMLVELGVRFSKQYFIDNYGLQDEYFDVTAPTTGQGFSSSDKKKTSYYLNPFA